MYSKTTTTTFLCGLVAASGAMAGDYPTYKAEPSYTANNVSVAKTYPTASASPVWQYYNMTVPTTVVVPALTTVCPYATTMTYNNVAYTATKGETITVTNCPCTVTKVRFTILFQTSMVMAMIKNMDV